MTRKLFRGGSLLPALLFASASPTVVLDAATHWAAPVPPSVSREFRGVWVTPLDAMTGPDWPSRPGLPVEQQKAELRALLDRARAIGLNAVVMHVRMAGDALYPSKLVPWTAFLSGTSGVAPGGDFDPLAFAIAESHARGLQFHAWFNPFRAMLPNFAGRAAPSHVTRAKPSWIRKYGTQTWIDPGEPAARAAVLAQMMEVVDRYDIDAIHLDDYFYPYREQRTVTRRVGGRRVSAREDIPFPDDVTWNRHGVRRFANRADWRRANIDTFVAQLYSSVKTRKPWVMVGISPFGIWKSGTPPGITGLDAHAEIYADARKWLLEGWVDYMAPQLYWPIQGVQRRFTTLDDWWRTQNPHGRALWPGLFTAQVAVNRTGWTIHEMPAQVERLRYTRELTGESVGHIHFRWGALTANNQAVAERLRTSVYSSPAIVPAMPWLGGSPPAAPKLARAGSSVEVQRGDATTITWWMVQSLGADSVWRMALLRATDQRMLLDPAGARSIAVTAIDRAGQTSQPTLLDLP